MLKGNQSQAMDAATFPCAIFRIALCAAAPVQDSIAVDHLSLVSGPELLATLVGGVLFPTLNRLVFALYRSLRRRHATRQLEKEQGIELLRAGVVREATKHYIRPRCSMLDPEGEGEAKALLPTQEPAFARLDRLLEDDVSGRNHHHVLVLASSGIGKTSLLLNYWVHNRERPMRRRHKIVFVPLSDERAGSYLRSVKNPARTVAFLDALDEEALARNDPHERLRYWLKECEHFRRVVITCRTQFFTSDATIPTDTGLMRTGAIGLEGKTHTLYKLYLLPFSTEEESRYLTKRYGFARRRQRLEAAKLVSQVKTLSMRPMVLAYLPQLVQHQTLGHKELATASEVYESIVEQWLLREAHCVPPDQLRAFSNRIAVEIFWRYSAGQAERVPFADIGGLARQWGIDLEAWKLTGRSLLVRNSRGDRFFAHRSIYEYLCSTQVESLMAKGRNLATPTAQMVTFIQEMQTLGRITLTDAVCDWLGDAHLPLFQLRPCSGDLKEKCVPGARLVLQNLEDTYLRQVDLSNADLRHAGLSRADLGDALLRDANLFKANLYGTNLRRAQLSGANLEGANLRGANLAHAELRAANLKGSNLAKTKLSHTDLRDACLVNTDLRSAVLWRADLRGADLHGADLSTADLRGALLTGVQGLSSQQLAHLESRDGVVEPL